MRRIPPTFVLLLAMLQGAIASGIGSRLAYLDGDDPYYPNGSFPKFTTPMWVGEDDVEAVIALTIDDMCRPFPKGRPEGLPVYARQPRVYLDFLQPVVDRLLKIDGRAPVSVFCLQLDESDATVERMLRLGMSMECHTFTHPVPLMRAGGGEDSLALVKADYLRSVSSLQQVEGSQPVAHRTPGCDARNTASPRFFTEVFPLSSLQMDSSIFTAFAKPVPGLPTEWFFHPGGRPRFARFIAGIPFTRKFVNYVDSYPYPYVINRRIWELPAIIPGDAHGVHAYGRNSDETVQDWKRALDIIVSQRGVMTICFHPHGYIRAEQLVAFIDYADKTYGNKITFLNCREIMDRITMNALAEQPLVDSNGRDNGVRVLDINADGYLDVAIANPNKRVTRIWNARARRFDDAGFPVRSLDDNIQFMTAGKNGQAGLAVLREGNVNLWRFDDEKWERTRSLRSIGPVRRSHFRDLNGDGISDIIMDKRALLSRSGDRWKPAPFELPRPLDSATRFVDIDGDGDDDFIHSDEKGYAVWLFSDSRSGWDKKLISGPAGTAALIPPIAVKGRNNGAWFREGEMAVVNEFTANPKADHVIIRKFQDWLATQ